jgi:menaquinone-dependent protoporphyrinogen IX oxidase
MNALFTDKPTTHYILIGNRKRKVYARYNWDNTFIRFVVKRTKQEIEKERNKYLPANVGILPWYEVFDYQFC